MKFSHREFNLYNLITAIRGGVSNAVKRYSHANMLHLPGWNPAIMEMSDWIDHLLNCKLVMKIHYYYYYNFSYPDELHDRHADYPLCPEHRTPNVEHLSPKQIEMKMTLARDALIRSGKNFIGPLQFPKYVLHLVLLFTFNKLWNISRTYNRYSLIFFLVIFMCNWVRY